MNSVVWVISCLQLGRPRADSGAGMTQVATPSHPVEAHASRMGAGRPGAQRLNDAPCATHPGTPHDQLARRLVGQHPDPATPSTLRSVQLST